MDSFVLVRCEFLDAATFRCKIDLERWRTLENRCYAEKVYWTRIGQGKLRAMYHEITMSHPQKGYGCTVYITGAFECISRPHTSISYTSRCETPQKNSSRSTTYPKCHVPVTSIPTGRNPQLPSLAFRTSPPPRYTSYTVPAAPTTPRAFPPTAGAIFLPVLDANGA